MDENTIIHLRHLSGRTGKPALIEFTTGEPIIKAGSIVNVIYVLRNGTVSTEPGKGKKPFYRGSFNASPENVALIGALPYFTGEPSSHTFRAESDCEVFILDSAFLSRLTGNARYEDILPLAKSLVLNSDTTHVILPIVRRQVEKFEALENNPGMTAEEAELLREDLKERFPAPASSLGAVVVMDRYVRERSHGDHLCRAALEMFNYLCAKRTKIARNQSLVHAPSILPPPPPGSPGRAEWKAAHCR